ncbi:MAG: hypothetical protein LBU98_03845 [Alistipes sp.]|jgi:hypothetical protein|nr:hypothetical protein [Alistipes sp.]
MRLFSVRNIALLAMLLGSSCGNAQRGGSGEWLYGERELSAHRLFTDSEILSVWSLDILDSLIVVNTPQEKTQFKVYRIQGDSLKHTDTFLHVGRGPLEVSLGFGYDMPENNTYVVTGINPCGKIISIPKDKGLSSTAHWNVYENPALRPCVGVVPLDPVSMLVVKGADNSGKMFALLDTSSGRMTDLDIGFPEDGIDVPYHERVSAYTGHIAKRPHIRQFVHSAYSWAIVTIYDIDESGAVRSIPIHNEVPRDFRDPSNRMGYGLAVTPDYIFLSDPKLTRGELRGDPMAKNGFPAGYSDELSVYDWQGRPVVKLHLSEAVCYMKVDEDNKHLYAISLDADSFEYHFVRYDLGGVL